MMLDFTPVRHKDVTMNQFAAHLSVEDLHRITEESVARFEALVLDLTDTDVVFVPDDPNARDVYAADAADQQLSWTLGHVIAHTTASAEEYAAVATELARGVSFHGRPRSEVPWQTMTTVTHVRHRLVESRRIRLSSLGMWPDAPHLDNGYVPWEETNWVNAKGIFTWGLAHDDDHWRQAQKIIQQSKTSCT